jgi:hypothetical protein
VKARGLGLSLPLDGFEVSLEPVDDVPLRVLGDPVESARWSLRSLTPRPGFAAAVVGDRPPFAVRERSWLPAPEP